MSQTVSLSVEDIVLIAIAKKHEIPFPGKFNSISDEIVGRCERIADIMSEELVLGRRNEFFTFQDGATGNTRVFNVDKAWIIIRGLLSDEITRAERLHLIGIEESGLTASNDNILPFLAKVNHNYAVILTEEQMNVPLIGVASKDSGGFIIIDGWHRIYNANMIGREDLNIVILTDDERDECEIVAFDTKYNLIH